MLLMLGPRALVAGGAVALFAAAPAIATITPFSGDIFLTASSQADSNTQIFAASPLLHWTGEDHLSVAEQADGPAGHKVSITNHAGIDAYWDSPSSGRVDVSAIQTLAPGPGSSNPKKDLRDANVSYEARWDYGAEFGAGTTLNFAYDFGLPSAEPYDAEWELDVIGPDGFAVLWDSTAHPDAPGAFSLHFDPGDYRFELFASGASRPLKAAFAHDTDAHFAWSFLEDAAAPAPAPEPESWALLLGGFGAVGGTMRRTRRRVLHI